MRISDWSSDVCSSDLHGQRAEDARRVAAEVGRRDVAGAPRAAVVAQAGVSAGDRGADRPRPAFGDATRDIGVGTETLLAAVEEAARPLRPFGDGPPGGVALIARTRPTPAHTPAVEGGRAPPQL